MTDNPTPNDIALLREAAERVQKRVGEWDSLRGNEPRDRFAAFGENLRHDAMALVVAALAPGQHDGAAGEGPSEEWLNDPASLEGELPSTEQARAEGVEGLESRIAKLMIGYHVAICSPKGVVPDDEFYDPAMAADIRRMLDAGIPVKSAIPSGADALGGGR